MTHLSLLLSSYCFWLTQKIPELRSGHDLKSWSLVISFSSTSPWSHRIVNLSCLRFLSLLLLWSVNSLFLRQMRDFTVSYLASDSVLESLAASPIPVCLLRISLPHLSSLPQQSLTQSSNIQLLHNHSLRLLIFSSLVSTTRFFHTLSIFALYLLLSQVEFSGLNIFDKCCYLSFRSVLFSTYTWLYSFFGSCIDWNSWAYT